MDLNAIIAPVLEYRGSRRCIGICLALICLLSAVMTGTHALMDLSQHKSNEFSGFMIAQEGYGLAVLEKLDVDDEAPLAGAGFELYRACEDGTDTLIGSYTTGEDGRIREDRLPAGSYYWLETAPPLGYGFWHDEDGDEVREYPFTVEEIEDGAVILAFVKAYNEKCTADLIITKTVVDLGAGEDEGDGDGSSGAGEGAGGMPAGAGEGAGDGAGEEVGDGSAGAGEGSGEEVGDGSAGAGEEKHGGAAGGAGISSTGLVIAAQADGGSSGLTAFAQAGADNAGWDGKVKASEMKASEMKADEMKAGISSTGLIIAAQSHSDNAERDGETQAGGAGEEPGGADGAGEEPGAGPESGIGALTLGLDGAADGTGEGGGDPGAGPGDGPGDGSGASSGGQDDAAGAGNEADGEQAGGQGGSGGADSPEGGGAMPADAQSDGDGPYDTVFTFIITFVDMEDGDIVILIDGEENTVEVKDGQVEIGLKHGQEAVIKDLPAGMLYTVEEAQVEGYTAQSENSEGAVPPEGITVHFTNYFGGEPEGLGGQEETEEPGEEEEPEAEEEPGAEEEPEPTPAPEGQYGQDAHESPETPATAKTAGSPKTGDKNDIWLWAAMMVLSAYLLRRLLLSRRVGG